MIDLSPHHIALRSKAYEFAKEALLPYGEQWENAGVFPYDAFQLANDAGYVGMLTPKDLGGQGFGFLDSALIYESLARGSFAFTFALEVHNIVGYGLYRSNNLNEDIKRRITEIATGKKIAAIALTEPEAGSDPSSMQADAFIEDGGYIINGTKKWVTNGKEADYISVIVKNKKEPSNTLMLLVEKTDHGLQVIDSAKKMGANFVSTPILEFNQCFIPKDRLLSNNGLKDSLHIIDMARLSVASLSIGLTQEALEQTIHYLGGRIQFRQPIIKNQGVQWILADLYSELEAVRWLTYHAASLVDQGKISSYKISMAKLRASELAMKATVECAQLLGANGYLQSFPMERFMKYAKISQIIDGTSQIQKLIIGRKIEKDSLNNLKLIK